MKRLELPSIDLKDTMEMMASSDYKERFKAEYYQLKIRYVKLNNMCVTWDSPTDELGFAPTCPRKMYDEQLEAMDTYLSVLEARAKLEGVTLDL